MENCIPGQNESSEYEKLEMGSPLATLTRGYSITQDQNGQIIHSAKQVSRGEMLISQFADGSVRSQVIDELLP